MGWIDIAYCCVNGVMTGFVISLLSDYYSSSDCPPAQGIINVIPIILIYEFLVM